MTFIPESPQAATAWLPRASKMPAMISTGEFLGVLNLVGATVVAGVAFSGNLRRKGSK